MNTRPFVAQAAADADDVSNLEPATMQEQNKPAIVHDLLPHEDIPAATPPAASPKMAQGPLPKVQTQNLPDVYEQGGIRVPSHGFSIMKVAEMLNSVHVRDLAPDAKRAAILMALEASNIQLADVLEDATRREQVLNDYEARQQQTFQNYKTGKQQQSQDLQAEIERLMEQLRQRMQENEKEVTSEKTRLDEWRTRKREEERRIRAAASLFTGASPQAAGEVTGAAPRQSPLSETPAAPKKPVETPAASPAPERPASRPSLWKR
jgi:hypothetical protein